MKHFKENAKAALADVQLRGALKNATSLFGERRKAGCGESAELGRSAQRRRARSKTRCLSHLDRYLEEFVRNAESRGAKSTGRATLRKQTQSSAA